MIQFVMRSKSSLILDTASKSIALKCQYLPNKPGSVETPLNIMIIKAEPVVKNVSYEIPANKSEGTNSLERRSFPFEFVSSKM